MKKENAMRVQNREADVIITGGGASGLAAAIELGLRAPQLSVLVIEKLPEPARKIRATGSGRCNITNTEAEGFSRIMNFFREIGLVTGTHENGLVYPYSESASDVAELLIERALSLGIKIACGEEVTSLSGQAGSLGGDSDRTEAEGRRFRVGSVSKDKDGEHLITTEADYVILACGGKAGPSYGTTGDGYRLAKGMGHSIVTPVPALTGIECREWKKGREPNGVTLGGTRSRGVVSLYRDSTECFDEDRKVFEERGEIQFTRYGLSGICIFNMTRCMRFDRAEGEGPDDFMVRLDLFPDGDIADYIRDRQKGAFAELPVRDLLCTVLKQPLAEFVIQTASDVLAEEGHSCSEEINCFAGSAEMLPLRTAASLNEKETDAISRCVHALEFRPCGIRGWKDAQVTMGGVALDGIDEETSESKLVPGLYITGELADRDFMCGGFNLSSAWVTGLAAADSIAGQGD